MTKKKKRSYYEWGTHEWFLVKPDLSDEVGPYESLGSVEAIQKALGLFGWDIIEREKK